MTHEENVTEIVTKAYGLLTEEGKRFEDGVINEAVSQCKYVSKPEDVMDVLEAVFHAYEIN